MARSPARPRRAGWEVVISTGDRTSPNWCAGRAGSNTMSGKCSAEGNVEGQVRECRRRASSITWRWSATPWTTSRGGEVRTQDRSEMARQYGDLDTRHRPCWRRWRQGRRKPASRTSISCRWALPAERSCDLELPGSARSCLPRLRDRDRDSRAIHAWRCARGSRSAGRCGRRRAATTRRLRRLQATAIRCRQAAPMASTVQV